jgi:predicted mannosyl-3-phosphoglycerate phosphatase (HAD superfamily)
MYSFHSIRHARMTSDIKGMMSAQQGEITSAFQTTDTQLADVAEMVKTLNMSDIQNPEIERARQLEEEQRTLQASRKLLDEVLTKYQEDSMLRASAERQDHSTQVTFRGENTGVQIGVSHGPISGITFGGK